MGCSGPTRSRSWISWDVVSRDLGSLRGQIQPRVRASHAGSRQARRRLVPALLSRRSPLNTLPLPGLSLKPPPGQRTATRRGLTCCVCFPPWTPREAQSPSHARTTYVTCQPEAPMLPARRAASFFVFLALKQQRSWLLIKKEMTGWGKSPGLPSSNSNKGKREHCLDDNTHSADSPR